SRSRASAARSIVRVTRARPSPTLRRSRASRSRSNQRVAFVRRRTTPLLPRPPSGERPRGTAHQRGSRPLLRLLVSWRLFVFLGRILVARGALGEQRRRAKRVVS